MNQLLLLTLNNINEAGSQIKLEISAKLLSLASERGKPFDLNAKQSFSLFHISPLEVNDEGPNHSLVSFVFLFFFFLVFVAVRYNVHCLFTAHSIQLFLRFLFFFPAQIFDVYYGPGSRIHPACIHYSDLNGCVDRTAIICNGVKEKVFRRTRAINLETVESRKPNANN